MYVDQKDKADTILDQMLDMGLLCNKKKEEITITDYGIQVAIILEKVIADDYGFKCAKCYGKTLL